MLLELMPSLNVGQLRYLQVFLDVNGDGKVTYKEIIQVSPTSPYQCVQSLHKDLQKCLLKRLRILVCIQLSPDGPALIDAQSLT